MEHTVWVAGFMAKTVERDVTLPDGEKGTKRFWQVTALDGGGDAVHFMVSAENWEDFQLCVTDPERFAETMAARRAADLARQAILAPPNGAPPVRTPR